MCMVLQNSLKKTKVGCLSSFYEAPTDLSLEQMRKGTIEVREKLPANAKHLTDKQIQESLWHYYYDVGKTVTYLASTSEKKVEVKKKDITPGGFLSFCFRCTGSCMGYCTRQRESAGGGLAFS